MPDPISTNALDYLSRHAVASRLRLLAAVTAIVLLSVGVTRAQFDPFDPETTTPQTDTSNPSSETDHARSGPSRPVAKPIQFELFIRLDCVSGRILINIVSQRGIPSGEWSYQGEDMLLSLHRTGPRGIRNAELPLADSFNLIVTFDEDTAMVSVTKSGDRLDVVSVKRAPFLVLIEAQSVPPGAAWYILSRSTKKELLDIRKRLGPFGQVVTLDNGYYDCIPWRVSRIGRLNSTPVGALICVEPWGDAYAAAIDSVLSGYPVLLSGRE